MMPKNLLQLPFLQLLTPKRMPQEVWPLQIILLPVQIQLKLQPLQISPTLNNLPVQLQVIPGL